MIAGDESFKAVEEKLEQEYWYALAEQYENLPPDHWDGCVSMPGSYAWLLDVVHDFEAFFAFLKERNLTIEEFYKVATRAYLESENYHENYFEP